MILIAIEAAISLSLTGEPADARTIAPTQTHLVMREIARLQSQRSSLLLHYVGSRRIWQMALIHLQLLSYLSDVSKRFAFAQHIDAE